MSCFLVSLGGDGGLGGEQGGGFGNDLTFLLEWKLCVDRKQVSFYLCILTQPRGNPEYLGDEYIGVTV